MTAGRRVPGAGPRSQDQTNAGGRSRPDDMETHLALPRVADIECGSDIDKIIDNARTASDFLKAIAHESRLLILCILAEGEKSVTELETLLALRQPTVSQQLARLRMDKLVTTRREGKTVYYSLANEDARKVIEVVYSVFYKE